LYFTALKSFKTLGPGRYIISLSALSLSKC
jgi:hypothetical protein